MKMSESIKNIAVALLKAQKGMGTAIKDSKNPFFKSNYADINAINDVLLPALHENNISVLQPPTVENGINYIETVLMHDSGEFFTSLNEVIVAKQNDPQSYLAAQTYTRRGALQAFLNIGSEDDDGQTASGRADAKSKNAFGKGIQKVAIPSGTEPQPTEQKETVTVANEAVKPEGTVRRSFRRS